MAYIHELLRNKAVMSERYVKRAPMSVARTARLRASFHPKRAVLCARNTTAGKEKYEENVWRKMGDALRLALNHRAKERFLSVSKSILASALTHRV